MCGVLGLAGAAIDVYEYYSMPHAPGNYYPWFLTGPFALALLFIVWQAAMRPADASASG